MNTSDYESKLGDFKLLMAKYGLSTTDITQSIGELRNFHVTSPLVGRCSTGKSSLVNALLGRKVLAENTMPETSIPTEIIYGPRDSAQLVKRDDETEKVIRTKDISMEEVREGRFTVGEWSVLKLTLSDPFLKTVPDVQLVDMPGFGTSIELHNKAINEYLPESRAYILTFQSRSSTMEEDTLEFLKELKFHDMPVYVIVTKSRAVSEEELSQCVETLKEQLEQDVGLTGVPIYCTNAKGRMVDVEGFKTVLTDLERQSGALREKEGKEDVVRFGSLLKTYLTTAISKNSFSASDLEAEKEKRQKNLAALKEKLERDKADFRSQIPVCIGSISSDVRIALEDFAEEYANLAMDGRRETINARINRIIQTKVGEGIKNTFAPQVRNYLDRVASTIRVETPDMDLDMEGGANPAAELINAGFTEELVRKGILMLLAKIGMKVPNPVVAILSVAVMLAVKIFGKSTQQAEMREKVIRQFRSEAVPQIADKVQGIVENLVNEQADKVDAAIEESLESQMQSEEKALDDLVQKAAAEKKEKEEYLSCLQADLESVERLVAEAEA